jgi:hypothetical protein
MDMQQSKRIRKQPLKNMLGLEGDSSIDRRVKAELLTKPLRECGLPFWPLHEIEQIQRARFAGADDNAVVALVRELMQARKAAATPNSGQPKSQIPASA